MTLVTRFAPSPTGPLHLGHAFSAWMAHDLARSAGGHFLLRIEDIDRTRSRESWERAIYEDLAWLGIRWDAPPMRQSDRLGVYDDALRWLWAEGLIYACSCSRRDIVAAASAPQEGAEPQRGPDGIVYPGTCRAFARTPASPMPQHTALRLDMRAALERIGADTISFDEIGRGQPQRRRRPAKDMLEQVGDVVLSRRDFPGSYHLSVVLDDGAQGITHIVRGEDLGEATWIHRVLQDLFSLPRPVYHHHRLIRDPEGRRLAKRDDARAISAYRNDGLSPDDLRKLVGLGGSPAVP
ncbi:tRNA glutamyl-Q(34) synthetase GluQRS [Citreimonas salinaria]|nr:tRNA glutamyl-Q(34) synthetase GluQRS [Citreimonas salinaria]